MSRNSRDEYLITMRSRYARQPSRGRRSRVIDEFCEVTGHERKYAIKLLSGRRGPKAPTRASKPPGRPPAYGAAEKEVLLAIWRDAEMPCGKRLVAMLVDWLPYYERRHGALPAATRERLLGVSAATTDRLLKESKVLHNPKRKLGVKNAAVRAAVPVRAANWDVQEPGWIEADTVALCGGSLADSFVWALCATDIHTGWTEARAIWNRGQENTLNALKAVENSLPFAMKGIDTDNGSEFLNWHVVTHYADAPVVVEQTRSRPYHKNDQAHVEQKNWTHVRQLMGYERYGYQALAEPINGLLAYWSLWKNFYHPTMRQVSRERENGKLHRRHEKRARTPWSRVIEIAHLNDPRLEALNALKNAMDPFEAKERIEGWLGWIHQLRAALDEAWNRGENVEAAAKAFGPCPWLRYAPPGTGAKPEEEPHETTEKERRAQVA